MRTLADVILVIGMVGAAVSAAALAVLLWREVGHKKTGRGANAALKGWNRDVYEYTPQSHRRGRR